MKKQVLICLKGGHLEGVVEPSRSGGEEGRCEEERESAGLAFRPLHAFRARWELCIVRLPHGRGGWLLSTLMFCAAGLSACGQTAAVSGPHGFLPGAGSSLSHPSSAPAEFRGPSLAGLLPSGMGLIRGRAWPCSGMPLGGGANIPVYVWRGTRMVQMTIIAMGSAYGLVLPAGRYEMTNNPAGIANDNPGKVAVTVIAGRVVQANVPDVCK